VPAPDPAHRLDFHQLMADKASDPAAWPAPFCRGGGSNPQLAEVASGHFVEVTIAPEAAAEWHSRRLAEPVAGQ